MEEKESPFVLVAKLVVSERFVDMSQSYLGIMETKNAVEKLSSLKIIITREIYYSQCPICSSVIMLYTFFNVIIFARSTSPQLILKFKQYDLNKT